jgi:hypothetical protein
VTQPAIGSAFDMKSSAPLELRARMKGGREHCAPLSDRAHGRGDYTTHGLKIAIPQLGGGDGSYPNHVVEMALAHVVGNGVEAAYRRGDLFEKRRQLMQDWAEYCSKPDTANGVVVPLRQGASA